MSWRVSPTYSHIFPINTVPNRGIVFAFKKEIILQKKFVRIVLDTCVLVAAARSLEGASNRILSSLPIDGIEPCLSVALYAEWQEVLSRPENSRECPRAYFFIPVFIWEISGFLFFSVACMVC